MNENREITHSVEETATFKEFARRHHVEGCELFDVYTGAPIPVGYKSVAFSLTLRADDQTLTDDHAEETMQSVLKALKETFNATIR